MQDLESLGWDDSWAGRWREQVGEPAVGGGDGGLVPARVAVEYQDRFRLLAAGGAFWAQLTGNLRRRAAADRLCRPAVGDWVAAVPGVDPGMGTITWVLERRTRFLRRAAGRRQGAVQVIAANIDVVLVVTAFDRDFNERRLERYLTTVEESGAAAVVVVNKADLCADPAPYLDRVAAVAGEVPVVVASAVDESGLPALRAHLAPGRTAALVGSSGVGKSSLVNRLFGQAVQAVGEIRERDGRGRHTTTHRELMVLPGGGVLIDTPGMRELAPWDRSGLDEAFADIAELARGCRFRDCRHAGEPGCAVRRAVGEGRLAAARLQSYHKLAGGERTPR